MAKEGKKKTKKFEPNKRQAALSERQQTKIRYLKKTEQDDRVRALTRAFTQKNKEAEIMTDKQKARVEYLKKQGREDDALKVRNKARVAAGLKKVKPKPKPVTDSSGRVQTGRDRADAQKGQGAGYLGPSMTNGNMSTADLVYRPGNQGGMPPQWAQQEIHQMGGYKNPDPDNPTTKNWVTKLQAEGKYIGTHNPSDVAKISSSSGSKSGVGRR